MINKWYHQSLSANADVVTQAKGLLSECCLFDPITEQTIYYNTLWLKVATKMTNS